VQVIEEVVLGADPIGVVESLTKPSHDIGVVVGDEWFIRELKLLRLTRLFRRMLDEGAENSARIVESTTTGLFAIIRTFDVGSSF